MNATLQALLREATRMTRSGNLAEATAAIQRALRAHVPDVMPPSGHSASDSPRPHEYGDDRTIDQHMREVPGTATVEPDGSPAPDNADAARQTPSGGLAYGTFGTGPQTRRYRLFVPERIADGPMPLVLMLHGCTQNADDFALGTRMDEHARRVGFMVLYPEQSSRLNPQTCWNWFKHTHQQRGRGEPGLLAALTQTTVLDHGGDPSRVFVAGMSAGGAMAATLGHLYPDIFAAVAVHSGLSAGAAHDLPSAMAAMQSGPTGNEVTRTLSPRTLAIHGDQDRTVHPANAAAVLRACIGQQTVAATESDAGMDNGRRWSRTRHVDADGQPLAEAWQIQGAGHAWSGGDAAGSHTDAAGPDASAIIARFFLDR